MGKWSYGVVLDAGSSGTRAYVYRWLKGDRAQQDASKAEGASLPVIQTKNKWAKKIRPGISNFAENPQGIKKDYLDKLIKHALKYVPEDEVEHTPLYLLATAGMRQVTLQQQKEVMGEACSYLRAQTDFRISDCDQHVQVLPGEAEGLYGWIASNYLLGAFNEPENHDHGSDHHTYGFLEMGGASTQMAFVPNKTESEKHYNDLTLLRFRKVNGESLEYRPFVASWLGYGSTEARKRYVDSLISASKSADQVSDPCLPKGLTVTTSYEIAATSSKPSSKAPHLVGTGQFSECIKKVFPLLNDNAPCPDKPCLMNGKHVPSLDFDINHFVGVSRFYDIAHEIPELFGDTNAYDLDTYQKRVDGFCSQPWGDIVKSIDKGDYKKMDADKAVEACFSASWLINMVHDGFHVPKADLDAVAGKLNASKSDVAKSQHKGLLDPFQTFSEIHDKDVSWTLGTALLLASAQVPTGDNTSLPVGFGPNTGISWTDFRQTLSPTTTSYDSDDDTDWHDKLFSDSSRRVPGLLIFLVIIILLVYFLFGRERRSSWYSRFTGKKPSPHFTTSKRKRFAGSKLFGFNIPLKRSEQSYDRVLEAGNAHSDFELGDLASDEESYSDSSDTSLSRVGRASGWATPQVAVSHDINHKPNANPLTSPGYFDNHNLITSSASSTNLPGIANVLGRTSKMSRSESRETLHGGRSESRERVGFGGGPLLGVGGRGSRAGSPTRMRSPLMSPLKENVD